MRRLAILPVLFLAAGCIEADQPAASAGDPASLAPLAMSGCHMLIGFFPMDMATAEARMPDGFAPVRFRAETADHARAGAWIWTCDAVEGMQGGWADAWTSILVTPPEEVANGDAAFHAVLLEGANDRADMVEHYATWHIPIAQGEVMLDIPALPGLASARAELSSGPIELALRGGPESAGSPGVVRAFGVLDGEVSGAFEYVWTAYDFFAGAVTVEEGASIYGARSPLAGTGGLETGAGYAFQLVPVALPGGE